MEIIVEKELENKCSNCIFCVSKENKKYKKIKINKDVYCVAVHFMLCDKKNLNLKDCEFFLPYNIYNNTRRL